jgi:hypothetical protein
LLTAGDEWRNDLEATKAAGFKTTGQPQWYWYARKASCLNTLRENKPKSGLTITETALEKYKSLNEQEQQKVQLKKQYQKLKRAAQKQSLDTSISGMVELVIPDKGYLVASDYPKSDWVPKFELAPMESIDRCLICDDPLAFFEKTVCLWCEKENA